MAGITCNTGHLKIGTRKHSQNRQSKEMIIAEDKQEKDEMPDVPASAEKHAMDKRPKPIPGGDESLIQDPNQLPEMEEGLPVLPKDKKARLA